MLAHLRTNWGRTLGVLSLSATCFIGAAHPQPLGKTEPTPVTTESYIVNPQHLQERLGRKTEDLKGVYGGRGNGGWDISVDGDSFTEGFGAASDGNLADGYNRVSWFPIFGELLGRKINPRGVPSQRAAYVRPFATTLGGKNPFGSPGVLAAGWNRFGVLPNWNGTTVPIPAGTAVAHILEPHVPEGTDAPLSVIPSGRMAVPTLTIASYGKGAGQCLVYRVPAETTQLDIVYVRPPGYFGNQPITMDLFEGDVKCYPKGGGTISTGTFVFSPSGPTASPTVTMQAVNNGFSPRTALALNPGTPKTLVVHCGPGGPFGLYSLGGGVIAYSGNYDRGIRLHNTALSGSTTANLKPKSPHTNYGGAPCNPYDATTPGSWWDLLSKRRGGIELAKYPGGVGNLALAILEFGINDSAAMTPAQYQANLESMVTSLLAKASSPAVVLLWMPTAILSDQDRSAYRAAMLAVAESKGVTMIDLDLAMGRPTHDEAIARGLVAPEGAHPSDLAHQIMGQWVYRAILSNIPLAKLDSGR